MRASQQILAITYALPHVRDFSLAIDGGAHKGDWTADLRRRRFDQVWAFEPAPDMAEGLRDRFRGNDRVTVIEQALWHCQELVAMTEAAKRAGQTRSRYAMPGGGIQAVQLDQLDIPALGLLKLDLEGAEMLALRGARETLRRHRPAMIIECDGLAARYGFTPDDPGLWLAELGAREIGRYGRDRIYGWV